jgi:methionyl-tRNA formyltransferase
MLLSIHCKNIFPKSITKGERCINIHPGYNPYNRGMFPHVWSIINKLPAGVTIHEMDEGIDSGPIIAQEEVQVLEDDTSQSLYRRIIAVERWLLGECLGWIIEGNYETTKPKKGNYNSMEDFKKLCKLNLKKKATYGEVIDHLRALTHPPYKNAYFLGKDGKKVYVSIKLER